MNKKVLAKIVGICLICVLIGIGIGFSASQPGIMTLGGGNYPGAPSYTIFTDGINIFAKNHLGAITHSGSDGTVLLQNIIDVADTASILFSAGEYYFSADSTNRIWLTSNLHIKGEGKDATIIHLDEGLEIATAIDETVENVTISDLTITSGETSATFSFGGNAGTRRRYISLQNIRVVCNEIYPGSSGLNIFWAGPDDANVNNEILDEYNSMVNVDFILTVNNDADAVSVSNQAYFTMTGCYLEARTAIFQTRNSVFSDNKVNFRTYTANTGLYATADNYNLVLSNNFVQDKTQLAGNGIMVVGGGTPTTSTSISITGNTIRGFSTGIELEGNVTGVSITGNNIYGTGSTGIQLTPASYGVSPMFNVISGNTITDWNGKNYGDIGAIYLDRCLYTEISGNTAYKRNEALTSHFGVILNKANFTNINGFITDNTDNDGIRILDSIENVLSNIIVTGTLAWGIQETGVSDYNMIVSCSTRTLTYGIKTLGANTKTNLCYNSTSWIS